MSSDLERDPDAIAFEADGKARKKPPQAYEVAMRLLARREHSAAELAQKLRQRGCEQIDISATLTTLAERGWQSDERYARGAVEGRARRGQGPRRIQQVLQRSGVSPELIHTHLQQADVDWQTEALALAHKYLKGKEGAPAQLQQKLYGFLQRRGYTGEQIRVVCKALRVANTPIPPEL